MGDDDDADCLEHVWQLTHLHLSLARGAEQGKVCTRCGAVTYEPDRLRTGPRPSLSDPDRW